MRSFGQLAPWGRHLKAAVLCVGMLGAGGVLAGCAGGNPNIRGTSVPDNDRNRSVVRSLEKYRVAVEHGDAAALLSMADKDYWDDAGTPQGTDDYGYEGLKEVLGARFSKASGIRYSIKYVHIDYAKGGREAIVDVLIDASYTISEPEGERRLDLRDQNRFVLTAKDDRWLFLSGM